MIVACQVPVLLGFPEPADYTFWDKHTLERSKVICRERYAGACVKWIKRLDDGRYQFVCTSMSLKDRRRGKQVTSSETE